MASGSRPGLPLLTTPAARKWYRSAGAWAAQRLDFEVVPGGCLEWLPQETIVFDGAAARLGSEERLQGDARFLGREILCFGRTGSGEHFRKGEIRLDNRLYRAVRSCGLPRDRGPRGDSVCPACLLLATSVIPACSRSGCSRACEGCCVPRSRGATRSSRASGAPDYEPAQIRSGDCEPRA